MMYHLSFYFTFLFCWHCFIFSFFFLNLLLMLIIFCLLYASRKEDGHRKWRGNWVSSFKIMYILVLINIYLCLCFKWFFFNSLTYRIKVVGILLNNINIGFHKNRSMIYKMIKWFIVIDTLQRIDTYWWNALGDVHKKLDP